MEPDKTDSVYTMLNCLLKREYLDLGYINNSRLWSLRYGRFLVFWWASLIEDYVRQLQHHALPRHCILTERLTHIATRMFIIFVIKQFGSNALIFGEIVLNSAFQCIFFLTILSAVASSLGQCAHLTTSRERFQTDLKTGLKSILMTGTS